MLEQTELKPPLRTRLFFIICLIGTAWVLAPLLPAILTGAVLAFLSEPLTRRLHRHFNAPPRSIKASALSLLTIFVVVAGFLLPFGMVVFGILERITISLRDLTVGGTVSELVKNWVQRVSLLPEKFSIPLGTDHLTALLSLAAQKGLSWLASTTTELLSQAPGAFFFATLALFSWGYCLWRGRILRIHVLRFLLPWPLERQLMRKTFGDLLKSLVAANIMVSLIQALIIGVFLTGASVPHTLLWTSLSFFLSFVPVVGTLPVTLGSALWCWGSEDSLSKAIAMLICALVAGTADNFLRPLLARKSGHLDSFWLFLAIMGGLSQFGIAGFILGPLTLALCLASAQALRQSLKANTDENIHA